MKAALKELEKINNDVLTENLENLFLKQVIKDLNLQISKLKKTSPNEVGLCKDCESQTIVTNDLQENVVLSDIIDDRDKMKAALKELEKINNDVMSNCDELKTKIEEIKRERDFEKHMKQGFESSFEMMKDEFIRVTAALKEKYSYQVESLQKICQQEALENKTLLKRLDEVQTDRDNLFEHLKLMNQLSEHSQIPGVTNTIQVEDKVAFSHGDSTFVSKMFKDNQSQTEKYSKQEQDELQKQKIIIEKQHQENRDLLKKIELFNAEKNKVDSEIKHLKEESHKLLEEKDNLRVALEKQQLLEMSRESREKAIVEKVTAELNLEVKQKISLSEYNVKKHCQELKKLRLTLDEKEKNIKELRDQILILETSSLEEQRKDIIETQAKYTQYEIIETEPKYTQYEIIQSESKYTQYEILEAEPKYTQCEIIESEPKYTQYEIIETEPKYTQCEMLETESKLTVYEMIESGSNPTQYDHSNSIIEDENRSFKIDFTVTDQTENDFKWEVFKSKRSSNPLCSSDYKLIEITNRYELELFNLTDKYVRLYEEKSRLKKELDKKELELKQQTNRYELDVYNLIEKYDCLYVEKSNLKKELDNKELELKEQTKRYELDLLSLMENSDYLNEEKSILKKELDNKELELKEQTNRYELDLLHMEMRLKSLDVENKDLHETIEVLQKELDGFNEHRDNKHYEETIKELKHEIETQRNAVIIESQNMKQEINDLVMDNDKLSQEIQTRDLQLETLNADVIILRNKLEHNMTQLTTVSSENEAIASECMNYKKTVEENKSIVEEMFQLETLNADVIILRNKLEHNMTQLTKVSSENEAIASECMNYKKTVEENKSIVEEMKGKILEQNLLIKQLNDKVEITRAKVSNAEYDVAFLTQEKENLESNLSAIQNQYFEKLKYIEESMIAYSRQKAVTTDATNAIIRVDSSTMTDLGLSKDMSVYSLLNESKAKDLKVKCDAKAVNKILLKMLNKGLNHISMSELALVHEALCGATLKYISHYD
ncbi:centromere-associated protein E-like [Diaphorina citri]|uniref:Centromere-associated protein E-like n=1 Tax=Diaphorina citri TaxID=121845 RepID=A0A3Q0JGR0_DIACI|nr:centromere-associated protein E-like [Diaphorina citri]